MTSLHHNRLCSPGEKATSGFSIGHHYGRACEGRPLFEDSRLIYFYFGHIVSVWPTLSKALEESITSTSVCLSAARILASRILQDTFQGDGPVIGAFQREHFLNMGTTFAFRQSEGTTPLSSEVLNIMVRTGTISIASCFRIIVLTLSCPAALCGVQCCSNLSIPGSFTCISGVAG